MKVLMLGWEYPPHISGGLGTACEGLTIGLARQKIEVLFVVPHFFGGEKAPHMELLSAEGFLASPESPNEPIKWSPKNPSIKERTSSSSSITKVQIPSLLTPYWSGDESYDYFESLLRERSLLHGISEFEYTLDKRDQYKVDMFREVDKFTRNVLDLVSSENFDLIHAHDWMTFPAGIALSHITKKPLVTHIHSLEYDRSGSHVNERIHAIEGAGVRAAHKVIAVSYYTRSVIHQQHRVPLNKIAVVHNGLYPKEVVQSYRRAKGLPSKVVLFLGRVTFQKGPDYFVEAASHVIPHIPDVLFIMAGAGDMLPRMMDRVRELGITKHFQFPGFLRGSAVEEMYSVADVYVMPSVSEPFGISALEAISFDTPVIISRQAGVAEVLSHALKVDFWDVHKLADLIINALVHKELREDIVLMAKEEVKRLRWDAAALKTIDIYREFF